MYVILVNDDDTLYGAKKERIMQRSKLVDTLVFIVNPIYRNTHDMTKASVLLEYTLPISRKYESIYLELSDELYNEEFLQYKLPFDLNLTSEHGDVELQLTFAYAEMDENGDIAQRVRKTFTTTIKVTPIAAWSDFIADDALGGLEKNLITMNAQIQALGDLANALGTQKADNLVYDEKEDVLQLMSGNTRIGDKVSVKDMLDDGAPVVDFNSENDPEDSGSEDNESSVNDSNVVEF